MRSMLITTSALIALSAAAAFAAPAQDAAYDSHAKVVRDSKGNCVRTKWQGRADSCSQSAAYVSPDALTQEERTVYFDFNSAVIPAAERAKLDQLATVINGSSEVVGVRIHGFTDQLGTSSYNNALSTKRAAAVKKYLDGKSRLRSSVAEVRGVGKAEPQAQCDSMENRDEKIACMAAERRVEVELKVKQ